MRGRHAPGLSLRPATLSRKFGRREGVLAPNPVVIEAAVISVAGIRKRGGEVRGEGGIARTGECEAKRSGVGAE